MKQRINSLFALRSIRPLALSLLTATLLLVVPVAMLAQQAVTSTPTDNARVISYQGAITASGTPVTGDHLITTTLYSDANGTVAVWSGTYKERITGGVFSVLLGSGAYPFPASQDFSKPLWIGVKIDGGKELRPLTQLSGAPYAISIPDSSVTADKMSLSYVGSISVNGKPITGKGTMLNLVNGPGTSLLYDETTNSLSFSSAGVGSLNGGKGAQPQGVTCIEPWLTTGNLTPNDPANPSCGNIFGFTGTGTDKPYDIEMYNGPGGMGGWPLQQRQVESVLFGRAHRVHHPTIHTFTASEVHQIFLRVTKREI